MNDESSSFTSHLRIGRSCARRTNARNASLLLAKTLSTVNTPHARFSARFSCVAHARRNCSAPLRVDRSAPASGRPVTTTSTWSSRGKACVRRTSTRHTSRARRRPASNATRASCIACRTWRGRCNRLGAGAIMRCRSDTAAGEARAAPAVRPTNPERPNAAVAGSAFVSAIAVENVSKHWTTADGRGARRRRHVVRVRRGHAQRAARPVGLRQVDDAAPDRGARDRRTAGASSSPGATSRACRRRSATSRWCSRATRCFRTCPSRRTSCSACGCARFRRRMCERRLARVADLLGLDGAPRAQAVAAFRRPAAARRAGTRDHRRGAGVPDGRAAVQSRRAAARRDARRRSARCSASSASRWCTSRTTRSRRCRWPTA